MRSTSAYYTTCSTLFPGIPACALIQLPLLLLINWPACLPFPARFLSLPHAALLGTKRLHGTWAHLPPPFSPVSPLYPSLNHMPPATSHWLAHPPTCLPPPPSPPTPLLPLHLLSSHLTAGNLLRALRHAPPVRSGHALLAVSPPVEQMGMGAGRRCWLAAARFAGLKPGFARAECWT